MNQKEIQALQQLKSLTSLFGTLTDAQGAIYARHLQNYAPSVLARAIEEVETTWDKVSRFPSLKFIIDACKKFLPPPVLKPTVPYEYRREAEQVIKSYYGQMALREGWGDHLHTMTVRSGKTDWDESDAVNFRASMKTAVETAMTLDKARQSYSSEERSAHGITMDKALAKSFYDLWIAMQDREKHMRQKYLRTA